MNQKIRQLAAGLMVCYVVLFVALNYWQVGQKEELDAKFDNTRQVLREFNRPRGEIISADGVVVARSLPDTTNESLDFVRDYPTGDLMSNVTGYFTKDFGSTQVERQYGDVLVGSTVAQQVRGLGNLLLCSSFLHRGLSSLLRGLSSSLLCGLSFLLRGLRSLLLRGSRSSRGRRSILRSSRSSRGCNSSFARGHGAAESALNAHGGGGELREESRPRHPASRTPPEAAESALNAHGGGGVELREESRRI